MIWRISKYDTCISKKKYVFLGILLLFLLIPLFHNNAFTIPNIKESNQNLNGRQLRTSVNFEWSNHTIKNGDGVGNDIAIDSEGFIYIAGKEYNNSKSVYDIIIAKYDSSSNQIWKRYWGGSSNDIGLSLDIDSGFRDRLSLKEYEITGVC